MGKNLLVNMLQGFDWIQETGGNILVDMIKKLSNFIADEETRGKVNDCHFLKNLLLIYLVSLHTLFVIIYYSKSSNLSFLCSRQSSVKQYQKQV
jgi:hypothetical protein